MKNLKNRSRITQETILKDEFDINLRLEDSLFFL